MIVTRAVSYLIGPMAILAAALWPQPLAAQDSGATQGSGTMQNMMMSPGMMMPSMDAANGRKLFAAKGCVVCHAVNGIGGTDAAPLDASTMSGMINPFDFVANMWRGARPMIEMQDDELGGQVEFTGQELADIIAFLHHAEEQKNFSESDIPPEIKAVIAKMEEGEAEGGMNKMEMTPEPEDSGN